MLATVGAKVRLRGSSRTGTIIGSIADSSTDFCVRLDDDVALVLCAKEIDFEVFLSSESHSRLKFPSYLQAIEDGLVTEIDVGDPEKEVPALEGIRFLLDDGMAESLAETLEDTDMLSVESWIIHQDFHDGLSCMGWENLGRALKSCRIENVFLLKLKLGESSLRHLSNGIRLSEAESLYLSEVELDDVVCKEVFSSLPCKELVVSDLSDESGSKLCSFLDAMPQLQSLAMLDCQLIGTCRVIEMLSRCSFLKILQVSQNSGDHNLTSLLVSAMSTFLSGIERRRNPMSLVLSFPPSMSAGQGNLGFLSKYPNSLVELSLERHSVDYINIDDLSGFIRSSSTLMKLSLASPKKTATLAEAIRENDSLHSLSLKLRSFVGPSDIAAIFQTLTNQKRHLLPDSQYLSKLEIVGDDVEGIGEPLFAQLVDFVPRMVHTREIRLRNVSFHCDRAVADRLETNPWIHRYDIEDENWEWDDRALIDRILQRNQCFEVSGQIVKDGQDIALWSRIFEKISRHSGALFHLVLCAVQYIDLGKRRRKRKLA